MYNWAEIIIIWFFIYRIFDRVDEIYFGPEDEDSFYWVCIDTIFLNFARKIYMLLSRCYIASFDHDIFYAGIYKQSYFNLYINFKKRNSFWYNKYFIK